MNIFFRIKPNKCFFVELVEYINCTYAILL